MQSGGVGSNDAAEKNQMGTLLGQPKVVLRRVKALKKLQLAEIDLESEFHVRLNQLEREFQPRFDAINQKRKSIVAGEYEPREEECDAPLFHGMSDEEVKKLEKMVPKELGDVKGIPDFWLDVLLNCYEVEDMIQGEDLEMLKHLTDITCELHTDDPGFTLAFHFGENPFFSNRVLKKSYVLNIAPDAEAPLDYDGPMLHSTKADAVNWIRSSPSGGKRNIHGEVKGLPSFFDFFDATEKMYGDKLGDEETAMEDDFEIAMLFRDSIIPKAVLYLTDEIVQEGDMDFDDEEDSSDDDDDDDGEDENMDQ